MRAVAAAHAVLAAVAVAVRVRTRTAHRADRAAMASRAISTSATNGLVTAAKPQPHRADRCSTRSQRKNAKSAPLATCQAAKLAPNHAVIAQLRAGTIARLHAVMIARPRAATIARVRMVRLRAAMVRVPPAQTAANRAETVEHRANRTAAASPTVAVSAAGAKQHISI